MTVAEGPIPAAPRPHILMLQWGRNLTVAEGVSNLIALAGYGAASMGPQLDSCGRSCVGRAAGHRLAGFNGAAT